MAAYVPRSSQAVWPLSEDEWRARVTQQNQDWMDSLRPYGIECNRKWLVMINAWLFSPDVEEVQKEDLKAANDCAMQMCLALRRGNLDCFRIQSFLPNLNFLALWGLFLHCLNISPVETNCGEPAKP